MYVRNTCSRWVVARSSGRRFSAEDEIPETAITERSDRRELGPCGTWEGGTLCAGPYGLITGKNHGKNHGFLYLSLLFILKPIFAGFLVPA